MKPIDELDLIVSDLRRDCSVNYDYSRRLARVAEQLRSELAALEERAIVATAAEDQDLWADRRYEHDRDEREERAEAEWIERRAGE